MTRKLVTLDDLTSECGYFGTGALYFSDDIPNNGYACSHPEQEEKCRGFGLCFSWSCPIAYEATMSDLRELGDDLYRQYASENPHDDDIPRGGASWMVYEPTGDAHDG